MAWVFELLTLSAGDARERVSAERERRKGFLRRALASPMPEVREFARVAARGLAEIGADVGRLTDIGGGGLGISTLHPLPVGHRTNVRLEDIDSGLSYEFPCVVVWSRDGSDPGIGVRFWGKPTREYRGL
ncbi:MAG: PilZ domain-containing protein [Deltaproteobacteria bacterium]|nr:PilZ domain-containing protein [Deltaproteobacteria bacterium]